MKKNRNNEYLNRNYHLKIITNFVVYYFYLTTVKIIYPNLKNQSKLYFLIYPILYYEKLYLIILTYLTNFI